MKTYRVYLTETVEYSYDVEAKSPEEARDKVYQGDYDDKTYEAWDAFDCEIKDVEEKE